MPSPRRGRGTRFTPGLPPAAPFLGVKKGRKEPLRRGRFRFLPLLRTSLIETAKEGAAAPSLDSPRGSTPPADTVQGPTFGPNSAFIIPNCPRPLSGAARQLLARLAVPEKCCGVTLVPPCRICHSRACFATARQWRGCGDCAPPFSAAGSGRAQSPLSKGRHRDVREARDAVLALPLMAPFVKGGSAGGGGGSTPIVRLADTSTPPSTLHTLNSLEDCPLPCYNGSSPKKAVTK